jgi:hypothetical protein
MIHLLRALKLLLVSAVLAGAGLLALSSRPPLARAPQVDPLAGLVAPPEVRFMRGFVMQVNPSLAVEDPDCAAVLPGAIYRKSLQRGLDWRRVLVLAWQESDFDCHAKNRADRGGAYGPFQLRRLWTPVIGDPRPQYFDPELAVDRVVQVIAYYQDSERYQQLVQQRFHNALLCLYNTGESLRRINMPYCRQVGSKLKTVLAAWRTFQANERSQARLAAPRIPAG